jgi:hypothetical protein
MGLQDGVETVRNVFERALTTAGLHAANGAVLWEAYLAFENVMLGMIQVILYRNGFACDYIGIYQIRCTNPWCQVTWVTKFCAMVPSLWVFSVELASCHSSNAYNFEMACQVVENLCSSCDWGL